VDLGSLSLKARVYYFLGDLTRQEADNRHANFISLSTTDSIGGYSTSYLTYLQMTIFAARFLHLLASSCLITVQTGEQDQYL